MMPFALALLWVENALIASLFTDSFGQANRVPVLVLASPDTASSRGECQPFNPPRFHRVHE
jgi:hypothetical protein